MIRTPNGKPSSCVRHIQPQKPLGRSHLHFGKFAKLENFQSEHQLGLEIESEMEINSISSIQGWSHNILPHMSKGGYILILHFKQSGMCIGTLYQNLVQFLVSIFFHFLCWDFIASLLNAWYKCKEGL